MIPSFRWFGPDDAVCLEQIRQIPGVRGIVTALHDLPAGVPWPAQDMLERVQIVEDAGLSLEVVESLPVHEDIKLGHPRRDRYLDAWCRSLEGIGAAGVPVVCYNFMPLFDWTRTDLERPAADGSTSPAYDEAVLARLGDEGVAGGLPGWSEGHQRAASPELLAAWRRVEAEALWDHLAHFLEVVVPVAESAGVRLAIHPDDPPWPILGLPRIVTDGPALERIVGLHDSPTNGITFCTGSLGARADNDLPAMIRRLGHRIHFMHVRNVLHTGPRSFHEVAHPTAFGDVDMGAVVSALRDVGFAGPMRPDHGRRIWNEEGPPAYGLYDRALGIAYLQGLWEGLGARRP